MANNRFLEQLKSNSLFIKNFTYLSLVEVINIIVPFIILPYLITTLGKSNYGLVIFAQSVIIYFTILQNFGLNTYAIKEISINSKAKNKLSSIVSNVISVKFILFFINLLLLYALTFVFPVIGENKLLFFLSMWVCFFDIIFPRWYFQGVEKMKWITYVFFISKLSSLILIFTLVESPEDYIKVPVIYAFGSLFPSIGSLFIIFKKDQLKFSIPRIESLKTTTKQSLNFFISEVSIAVFANSNKVIIGSVLGMVELAYYDLADKIITTFRNVPLTIVRDSIYPRVAKTKNLQIVVKTTKIMSVYAILVVTFIFLFAPYMIRILGGEDMATSILVLKLFSFAILTTHISNYFITVGLWSMGYEKTFRNLMVYSTVLFLCLIVVLWIGNWMNIYTLTFLPVIVDIYLIIHTYYIYKKEKLF
ncbi:putative Flippase [Tenacibaculum sp. 190524A05c]|uniref:oligosaccharide flippase family protein n=1 Tax=Tenacibaculum platacis TaxID=3137852 RepID=UPI0031FB96C4